MPNKPTLAVCGRVGVFGCSSGSMFFSPETQCEMVDRVDHLLLLLLNILFISFVQSVFVLFVCVSFRPDTTVMVDWVLKLIICMSFFKACKDVLWLWTICFSRSINRHYTLICLALPHPSLVCLRSVLFTVPYRIRHKNHQVQTSR